MLIKILKYWLTLAVYLYLTTHSNWSTKKKIKWISKKEIFPIFDWKIAYISKKKVTELLIISYTN